VLLVNRNFCVVVVAVVVSMMTAPAQSSTDAPLPPNSLYNLQVSLEDQSGETAGLDQYQGMPVLVTMFYASCPHVCPLLLSTIRQMESKLSQEELSELRVLAISVDPERDEPELLLTTMQRHSADEERWTLARPTPGDVRMVAGVVGVKYKKLPNGDFSHTTKLVLLDRDGVPIASTEQIGRHDQVFFEALKASLQ
jgi:protein SCO1/2